MRTLLRSRKNYTSVKKTAWLMACFMSLLLIRTYAQQSISGTVMEEGGEPLPGVNVLVMGTSIGTTTDVQGKYVISLPNGAETLVFSFIGYASREVAVSNQTVIDVELRPDVTALEEIVVVGYGEQKKATLTGSIETISSDVFKDRAVTSPALALQGQTPGLTVTRLSPRPGREGISFQVRGATSINDYDKDNPTTKTLKTSPLIVIDGVPAISNDAFYNMNPNDIESISVLKDGAAAIYGSRAANGVILVTTKRGQGTMKVEYTSTLRINTIGIRPPTPTMQQYATVWLEAAAQDGVNANYWGWQSKENLELMQSGYEGIYPTQFWGDIYIGNYPRFEEMYGTAVSNQQNLSVSGSTEKSRYRISAGYAENVGNLKTAYDGQEQYNVRFNYDYDVTDWFKLETGVSYFNTHTSSPSGGLDVTSIAHDPPFFPSQNPYGQWYANFNIAGNRNSTAQTVDGGRENNYRDQVKIYFAATMDLYKDLSFKATASFDKDFYSYQRVDITVPQYTWYGELAPESVNPTSSIREESKINSYQVYGGFLNYAKTIGGQHNFTAMLGMTAELKKDKTLYGYRRGFEDFGVYDINLGSTEELVEAKGGAGNWGIHSYVGRVNYNYKEKYLLEVNGRSDASSKFDKGFKRSNYIGGSMGWIVTEEDFMKGIDPLDFLKVRASYGEMGNQNGIGNHDYVSQIRFGTSLFGTSAAYQNAAWVNGITSNVRTWERVGIANFGVDFRLLDHKLFGSFDYFVKRNDQMLVTINYSDVLGGNAPTSNSGTLETKGWEAMLGWKSQVGGVKYSISFNMSDNRNELVHLEGVGTYNAGRNLGVQGYPLNSWFLYQTSGYFGSEDAVTAYYDAIGSGAPSASDLTQRLRAGDTYRADLDGDGAITGTGNINDKNGDIKYMGDASPHYTYGINLGAQFRNFDFTAFFQGVLDQKIMRSGYTAFPFFNIWTNQTAAFIGKTWTEENPGADYPRMTANVNRARWNWQNNDFMLQNNRYARLKSLVIGYTLSDVKIAKYNLDRVRVYFSGNDLFEITSIKDGYDPEFGESSHSSYPFNRTWSLGLNVSF